MANRPPSQGPLPDLTALTNRAAALAFAAAFALIVALIVLPGALRGEGGPVRRIAASTAVVVAGLVTAGAWRARAQLRAAGRRRGDSSSSSNVGGGVDLAAREPGKRAHRAAEERTNG